MECATLICFFVLFQISDKISKNSNSEQLSLLGALYITPFLSVLGATAYLFCSLYLIHDKEREAIAVMEYENHLNEEQSQET